MRLFESFIRNPVKVAVAVLLVVLFGAIAIREMALELTPQGAEQGWAVAA